MKVSMKVKLIKTIEQTDYEPWIEVRGEGERIKFPYVSVVESLISSGSEVGPIIDHEMPIYIIESDWINIIRACLNGAVKWEEEFPIVLDVSKNVLRPKWEIVVDFFMCALDDQMVFSTARNSR